MHSAASDKASKASASPRNHSGLKAESPSHPSAPMSNVATPGGEMRESPKVKAAGEGGHAAQMEGASGVPPKIEEERSDQV